MNMKVKANVVVDATLDQHQINEITLANIQHILKNSGFDWKLDYYIKDGKVYQNESFASSHSWTEEKEIRVAGVTDRALNSVLRILQLGMKDPTLFK